MYLILRILCIVALGTSAGVYTQEIDSQQEQQVVTDEAPVADTSSAQESSNQDQSSTTPVIQDATTENTVQGNTTASNSTGPAERRDQESVNNNLVSPERNDQRNSIKKLPVAGSQVSQINAVPQVPKAPVGMIPQPMHNDGTPGSEAQKPALEEIKGINTVDLDEPRGNWLFKRIWWERAEQKYEKIRLLVEKLIDSRMSFFEKRTSFDKQVIEFYHDIGLDQGELKATVGQLISQLQKAREREGVLSSEDREVMQQLLDEKKSIEQLQTYVEMITKLDRQFDTSLRTLLEQMNAIRRYEQDAWKNFKEIARVLSDTKARELYYGMDVALSNIQEVQEYLQEPFAEHIDHVISMMTTHIQYIKDVVAILKEHGIDLIAKVDNKDVVTPVNGQEVEIEEEVEPQGWIAWTFSSITTGFQIMWDSLTAVVTWPYKKLFGTSSAHEQDEEEEADVQEIQEDQRSSE